MVDFLLLGVGLSIRLADTLGDNTGVALRVASIFAVLALHTGRVLQKVTTECTTHYVVELPLHKLVSIDIVNLLLPLTNGTLSAQSGAKLSFIVRRLDEVQTQLDLASRLQVEPFIHRLRGLMSSLDWRIGRLSVLVPWRSRRRSKMGLAMLRRIRLELWWSTSSEAGVGHPISRYPSRVVDLRLDPLPAQFLCNI